MKSKYIIFAGVALAAQAFFGATAFAQYYMPAQASQFYLSSGQTSSANQTVAVYNSYTAYNSGQTSASSGSCPALTMTLSRGMSDYNTGGQVSQLQQFLANRYGAPQLVIGTFGPLTQQYVKHFQQEQGLSPVGIVGQYTRAAIQSICGSSAYAPANTTYPYQNQNYQNYNSQNNYQNNQTNPAYPTCTISVNPTIASINQSYLISWSSQNATNARLSNIGTVALSGSQYAQSASAGSVAYTLTVTNSTGSTGTCSGSVVITGSTNSGSFSTNSTSGTAPFAVTFSASGLNGNTTYTINYGDGTSGQLSLNSYCYYLGCNNSYMGSASHTYTSAGTYTAILTSSSGSVVGTQTITVAGSTNSQVSFSASPTSGTAPLYVSFSASGLVLNGNYIINYGDGSSERLGLNAPTCAYGTTCLQTGNASHTYTSIGTYTATLSYGGTVVGSQTITVSGANSSVSFNANPTSGTTPLYVAFNASGLNQNYSYFINFGDSSNAALTLNAPPCAYGVDCSNSYGGNATHTYTSAGTYTAILSGAPNCSAGLACTAELVPLGTITITVIDQSYTIIDCAQGYHLVNQQCVIN